MFSGKLWLISLKSIYYVSDEALCFIGDLKCPSKFLYFPFIMFSIFKVYLFCSDPRRLEVRRHGDRQAPALHILHRDDSRHRRHPHGRPSYIRVRRPGQDHRDLPRQVTCYRDIHRLPVTKYEHCFLINITIILLLKLCTLNNVVTVLLWCLNLSSDRAPSEPPGEL